MAWGPRHLKAHAKFVMLSHVLLATMLAKCILWISKCWGSHTDTQPRTPRNLIPPLILSDMSFLFDRFVYVSEGSLCCWWSED